MKCPKGHEMAVVSLRAERTCRGCDERTGTLYDCESQCFGGCPACALKVCFVEPPIDPLPDPES